MKNIKIIFTPTVNIDKSLYPEPASKNLPDWYKKTPSYINGEKKFKVIEGFGNQTIKKCLPFFDAMTAGYLIKSHVDIFIENRDGEKAFYWPNYHEVISFHANSQSPNFPDNYTNPFPKWNIPWSIKTDTGYSCLFINPMNNSNKYFEIFSGIVDTDQYINEINLPFILNENFEGIIPAGTPIAQVIPFKRNSFKMEIGNQKNFEESLFFKNTYLNKWVNNYKNKFWDKKIYK